MELYKLWKEVEKKYQMRLEAGEKGPVKGDGLGTYY